MKTKHELFIRSLHILPQKERLCVVRKLEAGKYCVWTIYNHPRVYSKYEYIYSLVFNIFAYCIDPWTLVNVSSKEFPGNRKGIEMKISFAYSIWYDVYYSIIIFSSSDILIDIRRGLIDNWQTTWNEFLCYSAAPGFLKNRRTENDQSLLCYLDWNFHIFRSCCNNNVQWERIMQQHFFSCVFDRSMKHILQEHILCHPTTFCHVKIASSYSITYLCWIINAIETKGLKNNITSIEC